VKPLPDAIEKETPSRAAILLISFSETFLLLRRSVSSRSDTINLYMDILYYKSGREFTVVKIGLI